MPPERFGAYLREFDALLPRHGRRGVYYGHFGDGCLHVRIDFDLASPGRDRELPGVPGGGRGPRRRARRVAVGRARRRRRPRASCCRGCTRRRSSARSRSSRASGTRTAGSTRTASCGPRALDDDLRVFVGLPTLRDAPELAFAHDRRQLRARTRRCLGVGKCVTAHGGVMCPSFRATGEEAHSTRGRARLLFEMANGRGDRGTGGGRPRSPRRWTCACRARAASATARSAWTWRPTRPSSSPSATAGGCARPRTTRWARCRGGCTWSAGCRRGWSTR